MNKIEQAAEDFCKLRNYLNEQRDRRKDGTLRHSLEADTAIDAFISGWNACKEQMMKNAAEGEVSIIDGWPLLQMKNTLSVLGAYKHGDKVKIIIVKEDLLLKH